MALLPPPDIGAAYVDESKRPSKDFYNWVKSIYDTVRSITGNTLLAPVVNVAQLPPAGVEGRRHFVGDSTVGTFGSVVVGGGGLSTPVFDDGTNWRIG